MGEHRKNGNKGDRIAEAVSNEAQHFWGDLLSEHPLLHVLSPVVLAVAIGGCLSSYTSILPLALVFWIVIEYGKRRRKAVLEKLNDRWKRRLLLSQQSTPAEPCEWLNRLLRTVWPNFLEPCAVHHLLAIVRKTITERKPRYIRSVDLQEFSLGSVPPEFGLKQMFWHTDAQGVSSLHTGFKWDAQDLTILLAAKLGFPMRGRTIRIAINRLYISGELRILPILDGQAVVYAFHEVPEVRIGVSVGGDGATDLPASEIPGVASWLERLFRETLLRTMVEPRRRLWALPIVDLKKKAVSGSVSLSIVSAQGLVRLSDVKGAEGGGPGVRNGISAGPRTAVSRCFVEFTLGDFSRRTSVVGGGQNPQWGEKQDMMLHGHSGTLFLSVYEQGPGIKCQLLGSCEIKMKYGDDDSTIFWAIGEGLSVVAARAEFCGKEVSLTVPLEGSSSGKISVQLCLNEWVFTDGSRAVANYHPRSSHVSLLGPVFSLGHLTGRVIRVTAVEGRQLAPAAKARKSDPYLTLHYGKSIRKTKTVHQDLNPVWSQQFTFRERDGGDECLKIRCYDRDRFGDVGLGSARVNMQGLGEGTVKDVWVPLEKIQSGEIRLKIEVLGAEQRNGAGAAHEAAHSGEDDDPPVSGRSVLELTLVEARNLVRTDWGSKSDPYVSVRYGNLRKRSKVVYKTLNPEWNQTMEFVEDGSPLVLHVKDYNTLKRSYSIGHCDLEVDSLALGKSHDRWIPLVGVSSGEIHVQITRRLASQPVQNESQAPAKPAARERPGNAKLQRTSGKVRMLLQKATVLADEAGDEGDGENEEMRQLIEDLEAAEDEREALIIGLQRDRDLLVAKVKELEAVMQDIL